MTPAEAIVHLRTEARLSPLPKLLTWEALAILESALAENASDHRIMQAMRQDGVCPIKVATTASVQTGTGLCWVLATCPREPKP